MIDTNTFQRYTKHFYGYKSRTNRYQQQQLQQHTNSIKKSWRKVMTKQELNMRSELIHFYWQLLLKA